MKTLIPFEPFRLANELSSIGRRGDIFDLMFSTPNGTNGASKETRWNPSVDITSDDVAYMVTVDMPGIDPKDVELTLEEGVLTIQGQRSSESEENNEEGSPNSYHCRERFVGKFRRSLQLPTEVDEEAVEAHAEHGVLSIRVPKKAPKEAKRIKIN